MRDSERSRIFEVDITPRNPDEPRASTCWPRTQTYSVTARSSQEAARIAEDDFDMDQSFRDKPRKRDGTVVWP